MPAFTPSRRGSRSRRLSNRTSTPVALAVLRAAVKPVFEQLEERRLMTTVWVNDNWVVTSDTGAPGLSPGDTVANTGLGDDSSVAGKIFGTDAFASIASAHTAVVDGDVVHVISGTYSTSTTITKSITLEGDNAAINPITGTRVGESILSASDGSLTLNIAAPSAVVKGFTIRDASASGGVGINITGGSGFTIQNNIITQNSIGVLVGGVGNFTISDNLISSNNRAGTPTGQGVSVGANTGTGTIVRNRFTGHNAGATTGALTLAGSSNVTVGGALVTDGNTFDNNSVAIRVSGSSTGIVVRNNNLNTGTANVLDLAMESGASSLSTFSGNAFGASGTYINYTGSGELNATANTFGGVDPALGATTLAQQFAIVNKIEDVIDWPGRSLVRTKAGQVYVTAASAVTNAGAVQRGIDAAVATNTVRVQNGNYTEQLSINKALTLSGEGSSTVISSPASLATQFVTSSNNKPVIYVTGTSAGNINNLKVDGLGLGDTNNRIEGIAYYNAGGTTDAVTIVGIRHSPLNGVQNGVGVVVFNDTGTNTVNITNSSISDYQKNGIAANGTGLTVNITGNVITGAGNTLLIAQNGIQVGFGAIGHINGNNVSGNMYSGGAGGMDPMTATQSVGILLFGAEDGTTVGTNTVNGNDIGIYSLGGVISITGNILGSTSANRYEGIVVDESTTTITGNTITGGNVGIDVISFTTADGALGDSNAIIAGNTISGALVGVGFIDADPTGDGYQPIAKLSGNDLRSNTVGIHVQDGAIVDAGSDPADANPTGLTAATGSNDLRGYTGTSGNYAIENLNTVAGSQPNVLARHNNFGTFSAAAMETMVYDDTDNAGTSTQVLFYPPSPVPTVVFVDDDWTGTTVGTDADGAGGGSLGNGNAFGYDEFANIQDAIDAVASGGTILVYGGTYTQNLNVNKFVTIDGSGSGNTAGVDTIVNGTGNLITLAASGASAGSRLILKDMRVTGGTHGVWVNSAVSFITLDNLSLTGLSGSGIEVQTTGAINDLVLNNLNVSNNDIGLRVSTGGSITNMNVTGTTSFSGNNYGVYTAAASASTTNQNNFNNITFTGTSITNNVFKGLYLEKLNNASFSGITVSGNGTGAASPAGVDINLKYGTYSNIAFSGVNSFNNNGNGDPTNGISLAIKARNDAPSYNTNPASLSNLSLAGLTINNSPIDLYLGNNIALASLSFSGVVLQGGAGRTGLVVDNLPSGTLSLSNISFASSLARYIVNVSPTTLTATGATFAGVLGSSMNTVQSYAAVDKIVDGVDLGGTNGLVRTKTGNIYVTSNSFFSPATTSADIQRAINLAGVSGDTIRIQTGSYVGNVSTAGKAVVLSPGDGPGPGRIDITGTLTLDSNDTLEIELNGTSAFSTYDNFVVSGNVVLGSAILNSTIGGGYTPIFGDVLTIIDGGGTVTGTFVNTSAANLPDGALINPTAQKFRIDYDRPATGDVSVVRNSPPTAVMGGPYSTSEGNGISFNVSGSTDPDASLGDSILTYGWDLDNNGVFEKFGASVSYTYAELAALGLSDGGPTSSTTRVARVRLTDNQTEFTVGSVNWVMNNVAPTIAVSGAATGINTVPYSFTLGAVTDPGPDTVTNYRVFWGDGNFDVYTTNGVKSHTYSDPGNYTIRVDLRDEDSNPGYFNNVGSAVVNILHIPPNEVWVDDNWVGTTTGSDADLVNSDNGTEFGYDQFATIQDAINSTLNNGGTIHVAAGSYAENLSLSRWLIIDGAGSGSNTSVDTVITPASGNVLTLSGSGSSTSNRLVFKDARITGGTHGVWVNSAVSFITLDNLSLTGLSGSGIEVQTTGAINDLVLNNLNVSNNDIGLRVSTGGSITNMNVTGTTSFSGNNYGVYTAAASASTTNQNNFNNITFTGTSITNNVFKGLYLEKLNNASFSGITVSGNGTGAASPAGVDINLKYGTYSNIAFSGVNSFNNNGNGDPTNGISLAIKARNDAPSYNTNPASLSNLSLAGLTINNSPIDLYLGNNIALASLSFSGVVLQGGAGRTGLVVDNLPSGTLSLSNISFASSLARYIVNVSPTTLTATGATFAGVLGSSMNTVQSYAAVDKIVDGVDLGGTNGLVRTKTGNIYVTSNSFFSPATTSADIQRAINLAGVSGDTIRIQTGSYVGNVSTAGKAVVLSPGDGPGPGRIDITGTLTLDSNDTLEIELNGTSAFSTYDNFVVSGNVVLGSAILNSTIGGGYTPIFGDVLTIIDGGGTVTGTFVNTSAANLPDGALINPTAQKFRIDYDRPATGDVSVVRNSPPTAVMGGPYSTSEGNGISFNVSGSTDPDASLGDSILTYGWDLDNNGVFEKFGASVSYTYAELAALGLSDGGPTSSTTRVARVRLTDNQTEFTVGSVNWVMNNVAPTIAVSGAASVNEGSAYSFTLGAVTDPGPDTVTNYRVFWGDGNFDVYTTPGVKTHIYADDDPTGTTSDSYTIRVDLRDEDSNPGYFNNVGAASVTVNNVAPVPTITGPSTGTEGSLYTAGSSITDAGVNDTFPTFSWSVLKNGNPYTTGATLDNFSFTPDEDGTYTINLSVTDDDGTTGIATSKIVTVGAAGPTVDLSASAGTNNEGSTYTLIFGTVTNPGTDTITLWQIDWGDGSAVEFYTPAQVTTAGGQFNHIFDGPRHTNTITVKAQDEDGLWTAGTKVVDVKNLDPTGTLVNGGNVDAGTTQTVSWLSPSDPSSADASNLRFDYDFDNDGVYEVVNSSNSFQVVPSSYLYTTGSHTVRSRMHDDDGVVGDGAAQDGVVVQTTTFTVNAVSFRIFTFTPNTSGFSARFSDSAQTGVLNLYDGDDVSVDAPDLEVRHVADNTVVKGSLVWDSVNNTATWVATGGALIAGDSYSVTLVSGASAWTHGGGDDLDGNTGVAGRENYINSWVASGGSAPVISMPDFTRGAGQTVKMPTDLANGLPVSISNPQGVTSLEFNIYYNPNVLNLTGAALVPGLPGTWNITTNFADDTPSDPNTSRLRIVLSGSLPLSANTNPMQIVTLTASVPGATPYGSSEVIRIENTKVNGVDARGDYAIHKAAFVGDTDRNGAYSPGDASLISRVVANLDTGFDAYGLIDPTVIGDVDGISGLSSQDSSYVFQKSLAFPRPEIPDIPVGSPTSFGTGPDPTLDIPDTLTGSSGGNVLVPIQVTDSASGMKSFSVTLTWDNTKVSSDAANAVMGQLLIDNPGWTFGANNLSNLDATHSRMIIGAYSAQPLSNVTGTVANVTFTLNGGFTSGSTTIVNEGPATEGGLSFNYPDGIVTVQTNYPGDANHDGKVDMADLKIVGSNFGQSGKVWEDGDFDGNGTVNNADLAILAANWQYGVSAAPAPLSASLLASLGLPTSTSAPSRSPSAPARSALTPMSASLFSNTTIGAPSRTAKSVSSDVLA